MIKPDMAFATVVNCRIGSLEKLDTVPIGGNRVNCRIGSLEIHLPY